MLEQLPFAIIFYLFSTVLLLSAVMVVSARNPVHSVLFLILAFFNAAALFLLQGAEFVAMLLVIVYVGAVAVLFLFVVMMLDIHFKKLQNGLKRYGLIGFLFATVLFAEMAFAFFAWHFSPKAAHLTSHPIVMDAALKISNTHALGKIIYTHYFYLFQVCGLILLVAMIGAIVLTLRHREGVKRQDITKQLSRDQKDCMEIKKVDFRKGI